MLEGADPGSLVGSSLRGKWHLDALLGVGGAGAVYAATHRNGRRAAIKVFLVREGYSGNLKKRLLRECRAANRIAHPGAVAILDDDVTETGELFIVMELLRGQTVDELLESEPGPLAIPLVLRLGRELLEILGAAHAAGVVHRDIKPSNVFLTDDGQLKLLDFGVACLSDVSENEKLTITGGLVGTPAFMAPEQARGRWAEVNARTDVWAVGALLFTLLSRRAVHDGETRNEVLVSAATIAVPPIRSVRPELHASVASVIDRALSFAAEARYANASEMHQALTALDSVSESHASVAGDSFALDTTVESGSCEVSGRVRPSSRSTESTPEVRKNRRVPALIGATTLLSLALGGAVLSSPGKGAPETRLLPSAENRAAREITAAPSPHPASPAAPVPSAPSKTGEPQRLAVPAQSARPPSLGSARATPVASPRRPFRVPASTSPGSLAPRSGVKPSTAPVDPLDIR